jgi:hypothetical protein
MQETLTLFAERARPGRTYVTVHRRRIGVMPLRLFALP